MMEFVECRKIEWRRRLFQRTQNLEKPVWGGGSRGGLTRHAMLLKALDLLHRSNRQRPQFFVVAQILRMRPSEQLAGGEDRKHKLRHHCEFLPLHDLAGGYPGRIVNRGKPTRSFWAEVV